MDLSAFDRTALIEACLFASPSFVTAEKLADFIGCTEGEVLMACDKLSDRYKRENSGLCLINKKGSLTITTKPMLGEAIAYFLQTRRFGVLSGAAMEVLAIAAYNQPVTKTYISQIRGVASSEIVDSLAEKGLLRENGRLDLPGKPMGYVTTEKFLTVFNLTSLDDLPGSDFFADGTQTEAETDDLQTTLEEAAAADGSGNKQ